MHFDSTKSEGILTCYDINTVVFTESVKGGDTLPLASDLAGEVRGSYISTSDFP